MSTFSHLSVTQAELLLQQPGTAVVDIRDEQSFQQGHIDNAQRIDNGNVGAFIAGADKEAPLIVCCYHGVSSQNAAQFFAEQGFAAVYSLDGGFEAWRSSFPID